MNSCFNVHNIKISLKLKSPSHSYLNEVIFKRVDIDMMESSYEKQPRSAVFEKVIKCICISQSIQEFLFIIGGIGNRYWLSMTTFCDC